MFRRRRNDFNCPALPDTKIPHSSFLIPNCQYACRDGGRQLGLVGRVTQPLRLRGVGEKAALHQHAGDRDLLHQVHGGRHLGRLLLVSGVDGAVQGRLDGLRQRLRPLLPVPEGLGPLGGGRRRQAVLVDAQQDRIRDIVHQCHPVVEV